MGQRQMRRGRGRAAQTGSTRRKVGVTAAMAAAALVAASVPASATPGPAGSRSSTKALSGPPMYFGAVLSLSGPFAGFELPMKSGLQAAMSIINSHGGILGHKAVLEVENDGSDPSKVGPAVQALLSSHRPIWVMPEVIPEMTDVILKYTEHYGIVTMDPGSGPGLFDPKVHPYDFSVYPANNVQVPAFVAAFTKLAGGSASHIKLAVINDTETADVDLTAQVTAGVKAAGGKVVAQEQVAPTATDVSVPVAKAKASGANELLIMTGSTIPVEVANAVQQQGWSSVQMVASPATVESQVMSAIPRSVASHYQALGEQIYVKSGNGPLPRYKSFAKVLERSGPINDLEISANLADAAILQAWAINKAHSTEIKKVMAVLQNLSKVAPPPGTLTWMPNPRWTKTDHTFDRAALSHGYWALLHAASPVNGTYPGTPLTVKY